MIFETIQGRWPGECLNQLPKQEDLLEQMRRMKDGAPGEDGARIRYIWCAGERTKIEVKLDQLDNFPLSSFPPRTRCSGFLLRLHPGCG